nr:uncharacterized protein CTRU02_06611 [Colletotrichum truncatum]KAF6792527.1 hypothetical protein CTRU02_06611 [Colletotrichum truncatum]
MRCPPKLQPRSPGKIRDPVQRDLTLLVPLDSISTQNLIKLVLESLGLFALQHGNLTQRTNAVPDRIGGEPDGERHLLLADGNAKERHSAPTLEYDVGDSLQRVWIELTVKDVLPDEVAKAGLPVGPEAKDEFVQRLFPGRASMPMLRFVVFFNVPDQSQYGCRPQYAVNLLQSFLFREPVKSLRIKTSQPSFYPTLSSLPVGTMSYLSWSRGNCKEKGGQPTCPTTHASPHSSSKGILAAKPSLTCVPFNDFLSSSARISSCGSIATMS